MTLTVSLLRFVLCVFLLTWEPLNVASETLTAWPTLPARGALAIAEVIGHALVAILTVAAGLTLWNRAPHGVALAAVATAASTARTLQVLRFTTLPHDASPDLVPVFTIAALVNALFWSAFLTRYENELSDHRA